ncbi:MAG: type II secretion system protein GspL [Parvularculaceae bacterium]
MADVLLLCLGESLEAPLRWGRFAGARLIEGGWIENASMLQRLADHAATAETVIALLPGEQVASRRADSFPKGAAKARAAAAYLMEDELAEAADALHVGVAMGDGVNLAVAVKSAIVEAWLAAFGRVGVKCDILTADYLALPSSPGHSTIVFEDGRVIAAYDGAGFALEDVLFAELAATLIEPAPLRVTAIGDPANQRHLPADSLVDWLGPADDARILTLFDGAIAIKAPPNLLQGAFQKRRALLPRFAPWRRAGLIAAAAASVFFIAGAAEALRAEGDARAWREAASRIHTERFPEAASDNPVEHARRMLAQGGGDNSFLALAARFAQAIEASDGVEIERMRFNAARGEFIVSVRSASDVGIEQLKVALAGLGVTTQDSGGYRRSGGEWTGELAARLQ